MKCSDAVGNLPDFLKLKPKLADNYRVKSNGPCSRVSTTMTGRHSEDARIFQRGIVLGCDSGIGCGAVEKAAAIRMDSRRALSWLLNPSKSRRRKDGPCFAFAGATVTFVDFDSHRTDLDVFALSRFHAVNCQM